MKVKHIKLIVIAYITINIVGLIFYYTIPKGNFAKAKARVDIEQLNNMNTEIMNNPQVLAHKILEGKYNIKNYNFNYEGKKLQLTFEKHNDVIFVDRKTSDDNKIEVYWYCGPITVNGIDFTNVIKEPNIKLLRSKLNVEYEKQIFSFTRFLKDQVISQFYEKKEDESIRGLGSGIIYIKVPKNLKILGDDEYNYIY
jgi:hypothetical protein